MTLLFESQRRRQTRSESYRGVADRLRIEADRFEENRERADQAFDALLQMARSGEVGNRDKAQIAWRYLLASRHPQAAHHAEEAMEHRSFIIRRLGLKKMVDTRHPQIETRLANVAENDPEIKVRQAAQKWLNQIRAERN